MGPFPADASSPSQRVGDLELHGRERGPQPGHDSQQRNQRRQAVDKTPAMSCRRHSKRNRNQRRNNHRRKGQRFLEDQS